MESEHTFVAPEGVYSLTEDHKPIPIPHTAPLPVHPTRLSTIAVRFSRNQATGHPRSRPAFGRRKGLLEGEGPRADRLPQRKMVSASRAVKRLRMSPRPMVGGTQDATTPTSITVPDQNHGLFGPPLLQAASAGRYPVRNIICARHLQHSSLDCNPWKASQRRCRQNRERCHVFVLQLCKELLLG
jgi:hypothetical protein